MYVGLTKMTWAAAWQNQQNVVRQAMTQISLGILSVWSESSLCDLWEAKDQNILQADSEGSDQTGWMPRLIWVFAGRTGHFIGFVVLQLTSTYSFFFILHQDLLHCYNRLFLSVPSFKYLSTNVTKQSVQNSTLGKIFCNWANGKLLLEGYWRRSFS